MQKVDAVQALTAGAGVAFFWGASIPFTVGAQVSYAPWYQFSDSATKGAFNFSVAAGFYVPLLDFN